MTVTTKKEAWNAANNLFPTDYDIDITRTARAGYPIYYSTVEGVMAYICDLGDRLEVNLPDGSTVNIWIKADETTAQKRTDDKEDEDAEAIAIDGLANSNIITAAEVVKMAESVALARYLKAKERAERLGNINKLSNLICDKRLRQWDELRTLTIKIETAEKGAKNGKL